MLKNIKKIYFPVYNLRKVRTIKFLIQSFGSFFNQLFPMSLWFRTLCLAQWLLLLTSQVSAAPGIFLPVINNAAAGPITAPLKVNNFSNMVAAQFVITWNKDVLQFQSVEGFALPTPNGSPFNLNETAKGILRFAWASGGQGLSLDDQSVLYSLRFNVIGSLLSGSELNITEISPTAFELVALSGGQFITFDATQVDITPGYVAVGFTLHTNEQPPNALFPITLAPNPASDAVSIDFELAEPSAVNVSLYNNAGQCLYADNQSFGSGQQRVVIPKNNLPPSGAYLLTVRTAQAVCTKPLYLL